MAKKQLLPVNLLAIVLLINFGWNQTDQKEPPKENTATRTQPGELDRAILPIKAPIYPEQKELDARNAKAPASFEVKAPKGAPKVLVVLVDDEGFGVSSTFSGPVNETALARLAKDGLRYNNK